MIVGETITVAVQVASATGQVIPNVAVNFSVLGGGGAVSSATSITSENGQATVSWTLGTTPEENRLTARVGQLPVLEISTTTRPGPPTVLGITVEPAGAQIDSILLIQPEIAIMDQFGNRITNADRAVTLELPSGVGAATGTTTVRSVEGIARFSDLELTGPVGPQVLRFTANELQEAISRPLVLMPPARSFSDREDDVSGLQVHVIYAVPSDGHDREFDLDTSIHYSVESFQRWLAQQTGGRAFRMDTFKGALDVSYFRLSMTDEQMRALGTRMLWEINAQLTAAGRMVPGKKYLAYYDGTNDHSCGMAFFPGNLAAMYLRGLPSHPADCANHSFAASPTAFPRYWEFAMLHDLFHTFRIVSPEAPNFNDGHVSEANDLMYGGQSGPWLIGPSMVLDVAGDDYFGPNVPPGIPNVSAIEYLTDMPEEFLTSALAMPNETSEGPWPWQEDPQDVTLFPTLPPCVDVLAQSHDH